MLLGVLVGAWVARFLGPERYGELAYAVAYVAVFLAVANLGADGITVRDISRNPDHASEILGSATVARLSAGFVCWGAAVLWEIIAGTGNPLHLWLIVLVGGSLVFQAADTVDLWFQSQSQNKRTVFAKLVATLICSGVKIALIVLDAPLIAFAAVVTVEAATAAIALYVSYQYFPINSKWTITRVAIKSLLISCWPFLIGGLAIVIYTRLDLLLVRKALGDHTLGIYAACIWILQIWHVVPTTLTTSLGPYIARRKALNEVLYRQALVSIFRVFFFVGLAAAILTYCFSEEIVMIVLGKQYVEAVPILKICGFALPLVFLGLGHNLWLINEGKYVIRLYGAVAGSIITATTILFWSPTMGILSACLAMLLSQMISSFLINWMFDKDAFYLQLDALFISALRPKDPIRNHREI